MPADEAAQTLEVAERRRPHAEAVRVRRLAVAHDEVTKLALRRLDCVVRLAGRRLDQTRHFADDRPFRNAFGRLPDDAERLPEFLHSYEVPIVGIARGAERHIEV